MGNTEPETPHAPARLPLLDGLRTVAAIGVMLYHAPELFGDTRLFTRTYLFVDLFFLLSGFVLTLSAEPKMARGLGTSGFMKARIIRLWPMMALGCLAAAGVFATQATTGEVFALLVLGMLMIPHLGSNVAIFPLNAPQWSLVWELVANLFHGLVLRHLKDRELLLLAGISGLALLWAIFHAGWNGSGPNADTWWLAAPRVAWSYVLGIWMARRWLVRKPKPLAHWLFALFTPLAALMLLPWLPLSLARGDVLVSVVVLPALFWIAATAEPPASVAPLLLRLGALSYPIYALHAPIFLGFHFLQEGWITRLSAVALTLVAAQLVALAGPRLRRALAGLLSARRTTAPATAA